MSKPSRMIPLFLMLASCAAGTGLEGQQMDPTATAAEIATLLRTERHGGPALRILTQLSGAQPRERLDQIADTVAAVAITCGLRSGGESAHIAGAAQDILLLSAVTREGIPYAGAGERLLANRGGSAVRRRPLAAHAATGQTRRAPASGKGGDLAQLARGRAVGFLARDMGAEGLAVVPELYERDLVPHPRARQELAGIARYHGWNR